SRHDLIMASALETQHGSELADIAELEEAIAAAESAVEAARDEVRLECGVHDIAKFNEAAAPYEKMAGPWLKKCRENGVEVVRVLRWNADPNTGGTMSIPTEEELQTGQFFKDVREFRKAHGLGDLPNTS